MAAFSVFNCILNTLQRHYNSMPHLWFDLISEHIISFFCLEFQKDNFLNLNSHNWIINVPSGIRWSFLWNTYFQVQKYRLFLPVIWASRSCCSLSEWIYSRDFPCHNHLRWIVRSSRRNAILWRDSNLSPIPILWHQIFVSWWSKDSQCIFVSPIRIP